MWVEMGEQKVIRHHVDPRLCSVTLVLSKSESRKSLAKGLINQIAESWNSFCVGI